MRHRTLGSTIAVVVSSAWLLSGPPPAQAQQRNQATVVAAEVSTIANQLALRPETAIDFSDVSGEYCFDVGLGDGGHMVHYAIDPKQTKEDVVDFVNAEALIASGLDVSKLPRHPGTLGSMEPNRWYYLPAGEVEPHHGVKFPFPLLIKAVNVR